MCISESKLIATIDGVLDRDHTFVGKPEVKQKSEGWLQPHPLRIWANRCPGENELRINGFYVFWLIFARTRFIAKREEGEVQEEEEEE